jgi:hypothetical protein
MAAGIALAVGLGQPARAGSELFTDSGQSLGAGASTAVALGDLDGDGDLDAFVSMLDGPSQIWVNQLGEPGGGFGFLGQALGAGAAQDVALGDLDGDGDLDAFEVLDSFGDSNQVWINQGGSQGGIEGVFQTSGQVFGDDLSSGVALGPLDGDATLDAFVARTLGSADRVWTGSGDASFTDSTQNLGSDSGIEVALGDLDGDGDLDAFLANGDANKVWINQGGAQLGSDGTFLDSGQSLDAGLSVGVALGDLDGDGDLDAFVANNGVNRIEQNQGGSQGGAQGVFQDSGQSLGSASSRDVALGDLDGDGDLDAFVAEAGANSVWLNQGGAQGGAAGVFSEAGSLGSAFSEGVALGDLDGDGDLDAFVANSDGPDRVWLGGGGVPGPGEVEWQIQAVDVRGNRGFGTSLALDTQGRPHLSYRSLRAPEVTNPERLHYAHWDGVRWILELVDIADMIGRDSPAFETDGDTSLALDSSGRPHVAYVARVDGDRELRHAVREAEGWRVERISAAASPAGRVSLALDADDHLHLAYFDGNEVAYAHFDGSSWVVEVVGAEFEDVSEGDGISLALGSDGEPRVAYYAFRSGSIVFGRRTAAGWQLETVPGDSLDSPVSLALDAADSPHIAHLRSQTVRYLTRGPGGWTSEPVADFAVSALGLSLALDAQGTPHIAFGESGLHYARREGGSWETELVDASNTALGDAASLVLDADGVPHIAYYDRVFDDLRYATLAPRWQSVEIAGPTDPSSLGIALSDDAPAIAYHDSGGGQVELAEWDGEWSLDPRAFVTDPTHVSLARDNQGAPQLAYVDGAGRLIHTRRSFDGTWTETVVDDAGDPRHPDLVLVGGTGALARIAWFDAATLQVKLARIDGSESPEVAVNTLAPALDGLSGALSATVLVSGDVGVFYRDAVLGDLRFAVWEPATSAFVSDELVDGAITDAGRLLSAGIDGTDGYPVVAFTDDTRDVIRYAWREGGAWQLRDAIPGAGSVGHLELALSLASREHAQIAYAAEGGDVVRFARLRDGGWVIEAAAVGTAPLAALAFASDRRPRLAFADGSLHHLFRTATLELEADRATPIALPEGYNAVDACRAVLLLFLGDGEEDSVGQGLARRALPRGAAPAAPASLPDAAVFAALAARFSSSTEGESYLGLYGEHGSEMGRIALQDPPLLYDSWGTLHNFMEGNEALVTGRGDEAAITQEMADQALDLWTRLRDAGSPALASAIDAELARWNDMQDFVGMTFAQWELALGVTGNEICGNCQDDDGNGLVDFEDPACCGGVAPMAVELQKASIKPRGSESSVSLKARLPGVEGLDPAAQDVFVQLATETETLLCAELPSGDFRVGRRKFKFSDRKGAVPGALGIRKLTLSEKKKDATGRLKLSGKNVAFETPPAGPFRVTLGFRDPGDALSGRCATSAESFREKRSGKLAFP